MIDKNTIPKHWEIKKLGEICKLKNGFAFKSTGYKKFGIPVIRISDINEGIVSIENAVRVEPDAEFENYIVKLNDILVAMSGATTGKFGVYKSKEKAYQNQRVGKFKIRDNKILNIQFLFHHIHSLKKQIEKDAYGGAQPNISSAKIEEMEIVLPPLSEQLQIVSKIEELFSELDKGKHQLETVRMQLKTYRQAVLKWAFEGRFTNKVVNEGQLPEGWKIVELKDICEIKRGRSKHRPRNEPTLFGGNYPFIQTGDIRNANGGYISKFSQTYSDKGLQQSKLWPKGTLCLTIAANIGETAILGLDACFPDSIVGLICDTKLILNKYTNYFFISYKSKLEELAPATAQKNINVEILEKVKIPLPSLEEQLKIIDELESKLTLCDKIEETIENCLQQSESLRQSILKKAFEGKLI